MMKDLIQEIVLTSNHYKHNPLPCLNELRKNKNLKNSEVTFATTQYYVDRADGLIPKNYFPNR